MPSSRPPESAAFGAPRRSWRKASAGPAAGRGASTATAPAGSGSRRTIHRLCGGAAVRLVGRRSHQERRSAPRPLPARLHAQAVPPDWETLIPQADSPSFRRVAQQDEQAPRRPRRLLQYTSAAVTYRLDRKDRSPARVGYCSWFSPARDFHGGGGHRQQRSRPARPSLPRRAGRFACGRRCSSLNESRGASCCWSRTEGAASRRAGPTGETAPSS
jgi:hypothetical protein